MTSNHYADILSTLKSIILGGISKQWTERRLPKTFHCSLQAQLMANNPSKEQRSANTESVSDFIDHVGDELVAAAAVPGVITYRALHLFFEFIGDSTLLFCRTAGRIFRGAVPIRETVNQMAVIGVNSIPIVLITVAFSGMVLSLYSAQLFVKWGVGSYVGGGIGLSITREIAPVLTAVVVAARAGSAMAAEIGSMKITEQIDALRALAVSPVEYLVVPRFLASVLMLPVLGVFGDIIGMAGAYFVAVVNGVPSGSFLSSIEAMVTSRDITMGLIKTLFFGAVIAIVGCQQGLRTQGGATGVGRATTAAVVVSIVLIYILNFFLAYIMFGGRTALN